MSSIVDKMREEIIKRSNNFESLTKGTKDEYNQYNEHVKHVYKYAVMLAKDKDVDMEVIELSALLHDIAMTDPKLDRSKHNEDGAIIAENLLRENGLYEEKIELIKKCIYNHSNKRKDHRTTLEEQILVDADSLSHFDILLNIYSLYYDVMGLTEEESIKFLKEKLTKDYSEVSDYVKDIIKEKYERIMCINTYEDIKKIK